MYSLLQAVPRPKELAAAAAADGQTSMAITDAGAMYGVIDFYQACHNEDIKPIIGLDAFLALIKKTPLTDHGRDWSCSPRPLKATKT